MLLQTGREKRATIKLIHHETTSASSLMFHVPWKHSSPEPRKEKAPIGLSPHAAIQESPESAPLCWVWHLHRTQMTIQGQSGFKAIPTTFWAIAQLSPKSSENPSPYWKTKLFVFRAKPDNVATRSQDVWPQTQVSFLCFFFSATSGLQLVQPSCQSFPTSLFPPAESYLLPNTPLERALTHNKSCLMACRISSVPKIENIRFCMNAVKCHDLSHFFHSGDMFPLVSWKTINPTGPQEAAAGWQTVASHRAVQAYF